MTVASTSYYDSLLSSSAESTIEYTTDAEQTQLTSDDFLTLLVTELQYQDPTDPMDNTEMVNQLTQYSQLDELTAMNTKLDELTDAINAMTGNNGLDYIGKQVEAEGYTVSVSDSEASTLYFELGEYAESVTCNIYDSSGSIVDTVTTSQIDAGTHAFNWDGIASDGNTADDGTYYVIISAADSNGDAVSVSTSSTGTVTGVSNTDEGVILTLDDGRTVNMLDVTYVTS